MNRSVERRTIFHKPGDYWAFIDVLQEAADKGWVLVHGYCVMPNHWHLVLCALIDGGISKFMQWLTNTHVRRYRIAHQSVGQGHLYKDRYKAPVIKSDAHFLTVMRYVETNAAVAGLSRFPDEWPWASPFERRVRHRRILSEPPVALPSDWGKQLIDYVAECRAKKE